MTTPFYITTPIYYVNDVPHLGHAYATIIADTFARYHRMRGQDTRFLTGTDEHGQKVEAAAQKRGLTPQQLVDEVAPRFDETWRDLGIEHYRFIRTTQPKHAAVVATLWRRIRERNHDDLYLETYQGWYCVGCEAFYTESQLVKDGDTWCCAIHKTPTQWIDKERSWFFKLSRYAEPLLAHIEQHPDFVRPEAYRNEVVAFLKSGLKDLSVSRTSFGWGIPAPEPDPEGLAHVIYVWLDALTNYLSDLCPADGSIGGPDVEKYWPQAIHVIGKDILRFHAVYWPAFLLSAGLPLPKSIFATGWWTVRGEKISKSMPATKIDPLRLSDALGVGPLGRAIGSDALRYYLLRETPIGSDGDFTFESLFARFNAELANDLGNLVNRSLALVGRFAAQVAPAYAGQIAATGPHAEIAASAEQAIAAATTAFDGFAATRALDAIWKLVRDANRYVDHTAPWQLIKDPAKHPELAHVLHMLATTIGVIGGLVIPVMPTTGRTLRAWVGQPERTRDAWPTAADLVHVVDTAALATQLTPLYPRLDDKAQAKILAEIMPPLLGEAAAEPAPAAPAPAAKTDTAAAHITFDDFAKLDLRVGTVVSAAAVPKKDKLLHLQVDLGEAKPRSIVSGIAQFTAPDALVGKQVIVVVNLAPRKLGGLMSEGMILAAGGEQILGLSAIDRTVPPGTPVK